MYTMIVHKCAIAAAMGLISYCPCQKESVDEGAPADHCQPGQSHADRSDVPARYTGAQDDGPADST